MLYRIVGTNSKADGPLDAETLRAWAAQGRLQPETLLAEVDTDRIIRAGSLAALDGSWPPTDAPHCGHCGALTVPGHSFCAHCGASQAAVSVWPPPPGGTLTPGKSKTSGDAGFVVLGVLACWGLLSMVPWSLMVLGRLFAWEPGLSVWLYGVAAVLILHALTRRRLPPFARGLLLGLPIALGVAALVILGLIALCSAGVSKGPF